jgi:short-subunit dehydrogenase
LSRRLCLVTGASAGIGAAFARVYAANGYDVALTGRRGARLEGLAEELRQDHRIEAFALPADLADPAAPERLTAELAARGRHVDALVNNAGYGLAGPYAASEWAEQRAFLQVMTTAVAELSHRALPGMVERRFGRIVNVASLLGLTPAIPDHGLYSAAKAFVVKFSEGLHLETLGTGVHVTVVCPGLTRSEFHSDPGLRDAAAGAPEWAWMEARAVAEQGYEAAEANRPISVPGPANKAMAALAHLLPEAWGLAVVARRTRRTSSPQKA